MKKKDRKDKKDKARKNKKDNKVVKSKAKVIVNSTGSLKSNADKNKEIRKKSKGDNLSKAKREKNNEFYTQLTDIEKELRHYKEHLKDKVIFCNCDDPFESNFVKFFLMNFNNYQIKQLIATGYKVSMIGGTEIKTEKFPYILKIDSTKEYLAGGQTDLDGSSAKLLLEEEQENIMTPLKGNEEYLAGDFRSPECIELLKKSDIVITNPPFSLFREYIAQLVQYNKKFLIIGNKNAITYKEIFPLLKNNKMWLGINDIKEFKQQDGTIKKFGNISWFSNLDIYKRYEKLELYKKYNADEYPKYDKYDAINVNKVADIPVDYGGVMGVPITFLDKYNPEQFEILDANDYRKNERVKIKKHGLIKDADGSVNLENKYARILIRRKEFIKDED